MRDNHYTIELILKQLIEKEEFLLKQEKQELKELPKGTLIIRKRKNRYFYARKDGNKEKGITKNKVLTYQLARRRYLLTTIPIRIENLMNLKACLDNISSVKHTSQDNSIPPIMTTASYSYGELLLMNNSASCNTFAPEHLIYTTASGIKVRSKSERLIADRLYHNNVAFQYESQLLIGHREIYPDFKIIRKDKKIVFWEHNGLMDNEEYAERAHEKIELYNSIGFFQHTNLICTNERDILDAKKIDEIIYRFILM